MTKLKDFSITDVIEVLKCERPIFTSEADFQLALAQTILLCYPETKVRLEYCYCPEENMKMYIDILILWGDKWIPIELKYKTKEFSYTDGDGCMYELKNQSAYDFGCYDYWRDISRIETISKSNPDQYEKGYAIFLTNSSVYSNDIYKNTEDSTKYRDFRIFQDREITGPTILEWNGNPPKDSKYSKEIKISGNYSLDWKGYSTLPSSDNPQTTFQILITEISKQKSQIK